jgi:hypothetical protein
MKYRFLRPVKGYAYFKGDVATLPQEEATKLVEAGCVTPHDGEEVNTLPEDIPARKALWGQGLRTVEEVAANVSVLHELPGISKRMAENIKNWLNDHQTY